MVDTMKPRFRSVSLSGGPLAREQAEKTSNNMIETNMKNLDKDFTMFSPVPVIIGQSL